ncbi:MAG: hypothetical protein GXP15_06965 [Gammaproteobacteria bacterium]|nr:hypothetical protein [Gammaproteobacteria bacterium]
MRTGSKWQRPILKSVLPVIESSRHVSTSEDAITSVARWMAYEQFSIPDDSGTGPFDMGNNPDRLFDVNLFVAALNFAFTDFDTSIKFSCDYQGGVWSDSEAMFARIHEAINAGTDLFSGAFLATVTRQDLARIFAGNIELPMLEERVQILNEVGATLVDQYDGAFHNFVRSCAPSMYAQGDGLMERLVSEFPRFNDVSYYHGQEVQFHKLPQLALWSLHRALHRTGHWRLADLEDMTAFADYIVPVALRLMGVLVYTPILEASIAAGEMIARDSDEEIEIRAHTIYATALLTDAINEIRPTDAQVVVPQIDFRLWNAYHATSWPHHLTRTVMY